jgi:hypothetical protein
MALGLSFVTLFAATSLLALGGGGGGGGGLVGGVLAQQQQAAGEKPPTREELERLLDAVRLDDTRIMRWHARSKTRKAQKGGGCDALPSALGLLVATTTTEDAGASPKGGEDDGEDAAALQALALEYATFCVTDNPSIRSAFSRTEGIHRAVVRLLSSPDPAVSAAAGHVVYIASFANRDNHYGFFRAGAVAALVDIILRYDAPPGGGGGGAAADSADKKKEPATDPKKEPADAGASAGPAAVRADQAMWALAALQNLAASYCETAEDGRCYWEWGHGEGSAAHALAIDEGSLPVASEGTAMRLAALREARLVPHLVHLACDLAVRGEVSDANPFPGENAARGRDESSPNLVGWAAAGALKNLALDPLGREQIREVESELLPCACRIAKESGDWLEQNKASRLLDHLRYGGHPCRWSGEEDEDKRVLECVDANFCDREGYHCGDYGSATDEECRAPDAVNGTLLASDACCGCGGGMRLVEPPSRQDKEL